MEGLAAEVEQDAESGEYCEEEEEEVEEEEEEEE